MGIPGRRALKRSAAICCALGPAPLHGGRQHGSGSARLQHLHSGRNETLPASPTCAMHETHHVQLGPTRIVIAARLSHPTSQHPTRALPNPRTIDGDTRQPWRHLEKSRDTNTPQKKKSRGPRRGRRKGHAPTHMPSPFSGCEGCAAQSEPELPLHCWRVVRRGEGGVGPGGLSAERCWPGISPNFGHCCLGWVALCRFGILGWAGGLWALGFLGRLLPRIISVSPGPGAACLCFLAFLSSFLFFG